MPARPVRCAIYTRQSVARPGRDPETSSCALQREACLALIAANAHLGWVAVDDRFDGEGESGADTDRLGLLRLVASVAEGLVDRVLVHRLDGLTRRAADSAEIDSILREHDVAISIVDGGIHGADDAITRFRLNALAVFAEFERDMIGERLADARAARRARGLRVAGRVPLGYVADRATKHSSSSRRRPRSFAACSPTPMRGCSPRRSRHARRRRASSTRTGRPSAGARRPCSASCATRRTRGFSPTAPPAFTKRSSIARSSIASVRGSPRDKRERRRRVP